MSDRLGGLRAAAPDLAEAFDDLITEVDATSPLDRRTAHLVRIAGLVGCGADRALADAVRAAVADAVEPVEVLEAVLQAVPYVGLGRGTDAVLTSAAALADLGVDVPLPRQARTDAATRADQGLAVQRQVVGQDAVDALHRTAPPDQADVQRWLSANCFGDVYTRGGLDVRERELLTYAVLVSLGGCDPQVAGHVAANVGVGNDRARLTAATKQLLPWIGYPRTLNALSAVDGGTEAPPTNGDLP